MPTRQKETTRGPGRPRSVATETSVLQGVYALMAARGSAATTIDLVARTTGVSKMTIYKWWPSREALLIDAFLHKAAALLPLTDKGDPLAALRAHAAAYAEALNGEFGRVQRAVIAECIARTGSAGLFAERYLGVRRSAGIALIRKVQGRKARKEDRTRRDDPAAELYDRIYGTLFYQSTFELKRPSAAGARRLVDSVLTAD